MLSAQTKECKKDRVIDLATSTGAILVLESFYGLADSQSSQSEQPVGAVVAGGRRRVISRIMEDTFQKAPEGWFLMETSRGQCLPLENPPPFCWESFLFHVTTSDLQQSAEGHKTSVETAKENQPPFVLSEFAHLVLKQKPWFLNLLYVH